MSNDRKAINAKAYYKKDICCKCKCIKEVRVLAKSSDSELYICRNCDIKDIKKTGQYGIR